MICANEKGAQRVDAERRRVLEASGDKWGGQSWKEGDQKGTDCCQEKQRQAHPGSSTAGGTQQEPQNQEQFAETTRKKGDGHQKAIVPGNIEANRDTGG